MRVLLCGGGTGGHVNPAIAIANTIKNKKTDTVIEFIGTKHGIESSLVPNAGYKISFVKVKGFKRALSLSNIDAAIKAVTSVWAAKKIIKKFGPDLVIGTGGYVSWPTVKAASKMGIPCLIHEQNAHPGVTTRMLSKYVNKICISFEESRRFFEDSTGDKIILTGNPINAVYYDYHQVRKELGISDNEPYILSYGGSMGADKVNEYVFDLMERYSIPLKIRHTHAVGRVGWEKYSAIAKEKGFNKKKNLELTEFIYDMPKRQAAADIIIGRSGAITLAELSFRKKAAIFIPSPNVTDDHQFKNAKVLADAGAAIVFKESELNGKILADTVKNLIENPNEIKRMEQSVKQFAKPDAASQIADIAIKIANNKKKI
ncbi:MAG: undecaprenyldiphospho-muramoylpentapeptide beta-N-acetylglucosaminyltransferase [Clostridiales bacterium GWF2_36_10]|nr:MAG: undecaprenyldiphospho-muramoylpentapeptide beta-N-acetylglucosaminyltransferase [Clostridiales bacterium GWF2_36_10]